MFCEPDAGKIWVQTRQLSLSLYDYQLSEVREALNLHLVQDIVSGIEITGWIKTSEIPE